MLVLYDIDGTLLSAGGAGSRALDRTFLSLFKLANAMRNISCGGKTDPLIIDEVIQTTLSRPATASEIEQVIATYEVHLAEEVAASPGYRVLPAAMESIGYLRGKGAAIGLATGNTENGARIKLERANLWREFGFGGYGSDSAHRGELVQRAIERGIAAAGRHFTNDDIWVIGDTIRDIAAARHCGVRVIAVATGSDSAEVLSDARPDALISSLAELANVV